MKYCLFPVRLIPFRPFPFCSNFPRFAHFFPFPTSPFSHLAQNLSCPFFRFYPNSFSPIFHFAQRPSRPTFQFRPMTISPLFPQGPFLFRPNAIFLISGPKTNKKFYTKLIPQFIDLILRVKLLSAHIIGEDDILVTLCFFYQCGYSYDDAYFWEFLGI